MRHSKPLALAFASFAAIAIAMACDVEEPAFELNKRYAQQDDTRCRGNNLGCQTNADCCSAQCDPLTRVCIPVLGTIPLGPCKEGGGSCAESTNCCSLSCNDDARLRPEDAGDFVGVCDSKLCISDNGTCFKDFQCCGGKCADGPNGKTCVPLNDTCRTSGNTCANDGECCSKVCRLGVCQHRASFCIQTNDTCADDEECCTGNCVLAPGRRLGTCAPSKVGGSCLVAGQLCGTSNTPSDGGNVSGCGGDCCSKTCATWSPTGVAVCQAPSGCRPEGETCRRSSDCCGGPGTTGGDWGVTCAKSSEDDVVGRCSAPTGSCKPAGSICSLSAICGGATNCCSGNAGTSSACKVDTLGVPRCVAVARDCANTTNQAGLACASSADCCNPAGTINCIPAATRDLPGSPPFVCATACVFPGGACSTNADCCPNSTCFPLAGSAVGVCRTQDGGLGCASLGQFCLAAPDSTPCCGGLTCNGVTRRCEQYTFGVPPAQ
jgi:hypothetical protein